MDVYKYKKKTFELWNRFNIICWRKTNCFFPIISSFINRYYNFVKINRDVNPLQRSIENGFDTLFHLFELYCQYLAEDTGFDSSSAVKYFDQLVKQATRELQAMVPLT